MAVTDPSLVENLNSFYTRFENSSISTISITASTGNCRREDRLLSLSDVRRALTRVISDQESSWPRWRPWEGSKVMC